MKRFLSLVFSVFLFASFSYGQGAAEITLQLNEQFFDTLLNAIFADGKSLEFPIGANATKFSDNSALALQSSISQNTRPQFINASFSNLNNPAPCQEKITILREANNIRTAVKFRDGKIYAPIAFSGTYNPPFIGCVDFQGWAETNINLEFDRDKQTLYGRAQVTNVQLGSVANMAGGLIARFLQSSIDKKINPIEILKTDKLNFVVPIQQTQSNLRLRANNLRYDVGESFINIHVNLEFSKAD